MNRPCFLVSLVGFASVAAAQANEPDIESVVIDGEELLGFRSYAAHVALTVDIDGVALVDFGGGDAAAFGVAGDAGTSEPVPGGIAFSSGNDQQQWWLETSSGIEHVITVAQPIAAPFVVPFISIGLAAEVADGSHVNLRDADGQVRATYEGLLVWDAFHRTQDAEMVQHGDSFAVEVWPDADAIGPFTVDPILRVPSTTLSLPASPHPRASFGFATAVGDFLNRGVRDVLVGQPSFGVDVVTASADDSGAGQTVVITTVAAHGLLVNDTVDLAGCSQSSYDRETPASYSSTSDLGYVVAQVISPTSFRTNRSDTNPADSPVATGCSLIRKPHTGRANILWGAANGSGPTFPLGLQFEPDTTRHAQCGVAVAVGDADDNGYDDIFVLCAPNKVVAAPGSGRIALYLNGGPASPGSFNTTPDAIFVPPSGAFLDRDPTLVVHDLDGGGAEIFSTSGIGVSSTVLNVFRYDAIGGVQTTIQPPIPLAAHTRTKASLAVIELANGEQALATLPDLGRLTLTISAIDEDASGAKVLITTTAAHGAVTGQLLQVANANVGGRTFDGAYTVEQVLSPTQLRTTAPDPGVDNDPAGTAGTLETGGLAQTLIYSLDPATHLLLTAPANVLKVPLAPLPLLQSESFMALATGDFDGDERSDVAMGLSNNDEVLVFSANGNNSWSQSPTSIVSTFQTLLYGSSVYADDFNADSHDDLLICDPTDPADVNGGGRCYLFGGSPFGLNTTVDRFAPPNTPGLVGLGKESLGWHPWRFSSADIYGDGASDLVVPHPNLSRFTVHDGDRANVDRDFNFASVESGLVNGFLGSSGDFNATAAFDVNSDGFDDLIAGSPTTRTVFLWFGGSTMDSTPDWCVQGPANEGFGAAVAAGDFAGAGGTPQIAVGAPGAFAGPLANAGRVHIFTGPFNTCNLTANPQPQASYFRHGVTAEGQFGSSLANAGTALSTQGDGLVVGAPNKLGGSPSYVAVFGSDNSTGLGGGIFFNDVDVGCTGLGTHVANAGNVHPESQRDDVLISANRCTVNGFANAGKVFLLKSTVSSLQLSSWSFSAGQAGAQTGPVAGVGDTNQDGFDDFAVAAPLLDTNSTDNGRLFVFHGVGTGTPSTTASRTMSTSYSSNCGTTIAGGVDFNFDGVDDVIVGEPSYDGADVDEGRVRIFFGGRGSTIDAVADLEIQGNCTGCRLGAGLAAFDVNNDNYGDVAVARPGLSNPTTKEGQIQVRIGRW